MTMGNESEIAFQDIKEKISKFIDDYLENTYFKHMASKNKEGIDFHIRYNRIFYCNSTKEKGFPNKEILDIIINPWQGCYPNCCKQFSKGDTNGNII